MHNAVINEHKHCYEMQKNRGQEERFSDEGNKCLPTEYLNHEMPTTPTMTPPMTAPRPRRTNSVVV